MKKRSMKRSKKRKATSKQNTIQAKRGGKRSTSRARRTPAKTPTDFLDPLIAASAQALGLAVDPGWHGSIKFNLGLILRLGALVDNFSIPDDTEPGPVFHA